MGHSNLYLSDHLDFLIQKVANSTPTDYLSTVHASVLNFDGRQWVIDWIHNVCIFQGFGLKSAQRASSYLDLFLSSRKIKTSQALGLLGLLSIVFTLRYEEGRTLSYSELPQVGQAERTPSELQLLELHFMMGLQWDLERPTAVEILESLILVFRPALDRSSLLETAQKYMIEAYADLAYVCRGAAYIALISSLCAMEEIHRQDLMGEWNQVVREYFGIEVEPREVIELSNRVSCSGSMGDTRSTDSTASR